MRALASLPLLLLDLASSPSVGAGGLCTGLSKSSLASGTLSARHRDMNQALRNATARMQTRKQSETTINAVKAHHTPEQRRQDGQWARHQRRLHPQAVHAGRVPGDLCCLLCASRSCASTCACARDSAVYCLPPVAGNTSCGLRRTSWLQCEGPRQGLPRWLLFCLRLSPSPLVSVILLQPAEQAWLSASTSFKPPGLLAPSGAQVLCMGQHMNVLQRTGD